MSDQKALHKKVCYMWQPDLPCCIHCLWYAEEIDISDDIEIDRWCEHPDVCGKGMNVWPSGICRNYCR